MNTRNKVLFHRQQITLYASCNTTLIGTYFRVRVDVIVDETSKQGRNPPSSD